MIQTLHGNKNSAGKINDVATTSKDLPDFYMDCLLTVLVDHLFAKWSCVLLKLPVLITVWNKEMFMNFSFDLLLPVVLIILKGKCIFFHNTTKKRHLKYQNTEM